MRKLGIVKVYVMLGMALWGSAVDAATLFSPPLVPLGSNQLDCYLVNVSDKERKATIQALDAQGVALKTVPVILAPGTEFVATVEAEEEPRYCKFIVDGPRGAFRASVLVRQDGVGSVSALAAQ